MSPSNGIRSTAYGIRDHAEILPKDIILRRSFSCFPLHRSMADCGAAGHCAGGGHISRSAWCQRGCAIDGPLVLRYLMDPCIRIQLDKDVINHLFAAGFMSRRYSVSWEKKILASCVSLIPCRCSVLRLISDSTELSSSCF